MGVSHQKVLSGPGNGNSNQIQPTDWNVDHALTGMLALFDALTGTADKVLCFDSSGNPQLLPKSSILTGGSPVLTGTPTAPTASLATNSDQIATTAFVQGKIAALAAAAPGLLDTLDELAAAIGDDPNYAATVTSLLALKASLASPAFAGTPTAPTAANTVKTAQLATMAAAYSIIGARGQCVLKKVSSNIVLSPVDGNLLTINGVNCTVPDAGVSLAPTGLTVGTTYYIYAVATSGVVSSLEASTTAYAIDTTAGNKGVAIKSGDTTRSLVGMVRPITGPAFADTAAQRFVRSWFNDRSIVCSALLTADRTLTGSSYAQVNAEGTVEFLSWLGETFEFSLGGSTSSSGTASNFSAIGIDSLTVPAPEAATITQHATNTMPCIARHNKSDLTEGYHYATLLGSTDGGTATWRGNSANSGRVSIQARSSR